MFMFVFGTCLLNLKNLHICYSGSVKICTFCVQELAGDKIKNFRGLYSGDSLRDNI